MNTTSIVGTAQTGIAWTGGDSPPSTSPPQVQNGDTFSLLRQDYKFTQFLFPGTISQVAIGATSTNGSTKWVDSGSSELAYSAKNNLEPTTFRLSDVYSKTAIGATSTNSSTNYFGASGTNPFNVTQQTLTGVTNIKIFVPMPSETSVPGAICMGRMLFGAASKVPAFNSYVTTNAVGSALGQYGFEFLGLKSPYRQYTTKSTSVVSQQIGGILGQHDGGYFELGVHEIVGPKNQFGTSRIRNTTTQNWAGVSNIQPFGSTIRLQFGHTRIRHTTKQLMFGKTNVRSLLSLTKEVQIQAVSTTVLPGSYTEVTIYSAKKAILTSSVGNYQRQKFTVLGGQITFVQLQVNLSPLYSLPAFTAGSEVTIQNENLPQLTTDRAEVTIYSSKKAILSSNVGSYHRHKNIVLNQGYQNLGAYWHTKTAEFTIAAGVGLPNISGSLALGQACGQLIHFRVLRVDKFLPVDVTNWVEFHLFPSTYTAWPALSSFSATLSGKTIRGLDSNVYSSKARNAVRLALGTVAPEGFKCDGQTDIAFTGSQVTSDTISITTKTDVTITGSQIVFVGWEGDGATSMAITAKRMVYGTDFAMDGVTDWSLTPLTSNIDGWNTDCATDCEFTCERDVYADTIHMDGHTDCAFQTIYVNWAGFVHCDGSTAVSILPKEIYTSGNTFNLDGVTNVSITASQAYGFGVEVQATGSASCEFVTVEKVGVSGFECDGVTSWTLDTVADYFVQIDFDGATDCRFNAAYIPTIQIVCGGVGDSFINALIGHFASMDMEGTTTFGFTGHLFASALWQQFTGIQTSVSISGAKNVAAYMNCDGSTTISFNPNQDQFGEIQWGPMDQVLYCLDSFVFTDGALHPTAVSILGLNNKNYILGPDYIFGYIRNTLDFGSPDFVTMPTDSFTLGGKTARSGLGYLGERILKKAVGHTRPVGNYNRLAMRNDVTEEFIRFPLFVDEEIDFAAISGTMGFTTGGVTAIAGYGTIGRDKEKYVTLGIFTNTRLTQETLEILATGDPNVDTTQVCYELLFIPNSNGLASQVVAEVLYLANVGVINGEAIESLAAGNGGSGYINSVALEMMHSIKAASLVSQTASEVLATGDPEVIVSQATLEALYRSQTTSFSNVWVEQVSIESIVQPGGNATINSVATEILNDGQGNALINSEVVEIIHNNDPHAVVNSTTLEIVNNSTTMQANVEQIAIEVLVRSEVDPTVAGLANNPRFHI